MTTKKSVKKRIEEFTKISWNNSNKVLVIQRRWRVVTDYKKLQKVCLVHYD